MHPRWGFARTRLSWRRGRKRRGSDAANAGFTLLEALLALSITSLLLGGIYTLLSLGLAAYKDADAADEIRQHLRVVAATLTEELRGAFFRAEDPTTIFWGEGDGTQAYLLFTTDAAVGVTAHGVGAGANFPSGSITSSPTSADAIAADPGAPAERENGLTGGSQGRLLVGYALGSLISRAETTAEKGLLRFSDDPLLYHWSRPAGEKGTEESSGGGRAGGTGGSVATSPQAAAAIEALDPALLVGLAGKTELSPLVTRFSLRFYDGTSWVTNWDSRAQGGLPVRVEFSLTFQGRDGREETWVRTVNIPGA